MQATQMVNTSAMNRASMMERLSADTLGNDSALVADSSNPFMQIFANMTNAMYEGEQNGESIVTEPEMKNFSEEELLEVLQSLSVAVNSSDMAKVNEIIATMSTTPVLTEEVGNVAAKIKQFFAENPIQTLVSTNETSDEFLNQLNKLMETGEINLTFGEKEKGAETVLFDSVKRPQIVSFEDSEELKQLLSVSTNGTEKTAETVTTPTLVEVKTARTPDGLPMLDTLRFGVNQTLEKGEFVMKLNPEELGEITIKLVYDDVGNRILEITTATAQTTKLINDELAYLREAFRPMQIEVKESSVNVVTESKEAYGSANFGNSSQNQSSNNWQNPNSEGIYFAEDAVISEEVTPQAVQVIDNLGL